jgi:hypothetical protein
MSIYAVQGLPGRGTKENMDGRLKGISHFTFLENFEDVLLHIRMIIIWPILLNKREWAFAYSLNPWFKRRHVTFE